MQSEPPKAEPPKRKGRWFQFSLRTLMIVVTLLCTTAGGYVLWQKKIVRQRAAMMKFHITYHAVGVDFYPAGWKSHEASKSTGIPLLRRWLGDNEFIEIEFFESTSDEILDQYRVMFPEAKIRKVP